jgi:uncharacterized DUF497 family protein
MQCMTFTEESPEIDQLVRDVWNTEHIATHGVTRDDVKEAIAGDTVTQATYKNRFLVLGPSRSRLLAVVIGPVPGQPGAYYTFSARPASRSERRYYQRVKGGEEQ